MLETQEKQAPQYSNQKTLMPSVIFASLLFGIALLWVTIGNQGEVFFEEKTLLLFILGLTGSLYGITAAFFFYKNDEKLSHHAGWIHTLIVGISLGLIASLFPQELIFIVYLLYIVNMMGFAFAFSRTKIYAVIILALIVHVHDYYTDGKIHSALDWLQLISFPLLAYIVSETIIRLQKTIEKHIARLNIINSISRKLESSLEEDDVHTWLKEAIQASLVADTYYVALANGDYVDLGLFYDDGEYFHAVQVPIEGTLGGWVIRNQKTLFLNDLRKEPELEGVKRRIIGQNKTSLSWVGVPMRTEYINGMIGLASYTPRVFTQDDVELLEGLAQQAALALSNARQHKLATLQARTDSLTGVYNHGYFLEELTQQVKKANEEGTLLSIIMLDVDYFKTYNDTYGHLVGDEVLKLLGKTIQRFIKDTDAIGRWGGEEFVISLPNTNRRKAGEVASRIQDTLQKMRISVLDQRDIPAPTVSQGIAEYPAEADEVFKLVDLADQRLYVAKERGRNQIELNFTE